MTFLILLSAKWIKGRPMKLLVFFFFIFFFLCVVVNLNPATYTIELNGNEIVSATECVSGEDIYYDIPEGLLEGNHNITIIVSDEMGNIAQNTVRFTVNVD